jgi:hypothetical protein
LIFWPKDLDVEGVTRGVSAWISTGRVDDDSKAKGTPGSGSTLTPAKRRLIISTFVIAMLAFPGVGFALGYFVLSSHTVSAGFVGLGVGAVLYFILTQLLSAIGHVALGRRRNT